MIKTSSGIKKGESVMVHAEDYTTSGGSDKIRIELKGKEKKIPKNSVQVEI